MIKNLHLKDIFNSPLKKCLKKNTNYNFDFVSFYGSFYITSESYLPICSNSFFTSTDLFGFYEKIKYRHLFTPEFYKVISSENRNIETVQNGFVLGSTGNYYHDLIDCFSRIFSYDKDFLLHKSINKLIIGDSKLVNILKEILSVLKLEISIYLLKENTLYKFENSIITANKRFSRTVNLYRKFFMPENNNAFKKTFISRSDSVTRRIENEEEIVSFLKNYSYNIETLSNKSLQQQIDLFSSSKIIITMHGAALTNLLFTPKYSTVIEITNDFYEKKQDWFSEKNSTKFNKYTRSMYNFIALECKINHYYYFSKIVNSNYNNIEFDFQKFTHSNLLVDIDQFKKNFIFWINSKV